MFSIDFIKNQIQYWENVLEAPEYYDDEEVGMAADKLAWWRKQLKKAQRAWH